MSQPHILLVEDELSLAEGIKLNLEMEGLACTWIPRGDEALKRILAEQFDLVLLDVMLPGMDGYTVVKTLRAESGVPVLMLTARGQELDRVMGLELGADDYLVKPFSFRELVARVRALLRRREMNRDGSSAGTERLSAGELVLDKVARRVMRRGVEIELTAREFELLTAMMERAGQAQARQDLLDRVWGADWIGDPRTLDVHIRWLREKIEDDASTPRYIETVRGFGYRFAARKD